MKKVVSAGGAVFRKNQGKIEISFIKDSHGKWAFPKGHVEKDESIEEAALREAKEEMGCKNIKIIKKLGSVNYVFRDIYGRDGGKKELIKKEVYYYLMELKGDEKCIPQKEEGIEEIIWVSPEDAPATSEYKNNALILKKAIAEIKNIP
ncbi:MAG: NUDIX domain-containing protein [bacterium]